VNDELRARTTRANCKVSADKSTDKLLSNDAMEGEQIELHTQHPTATAQFQNQKKRTDQGNKPGQSASGRAIRFVRVRSSVALSVEAVAVAVAVRRGAEAT
jgi:tellurite resistance protein